MNYFHRFVCIFFAVTMAVKSTPSDNTEFHGATANTSPSADTDLELLRNLTMILLGVPSDSDPPKSPLDGQSEKQNATSPLPSPLEPGQEGAMNQTGNGTQIQNQFVLAPVVSPLVAMPYTNIAHYPQPIVAMPGMSGPLHFGAQFSEQSDPIDRNFQVQAPNGPFTLPYQPQPQPQTYFPAGFSNYNPMHMQHPQGPMSMYGPGQRPYHRGYGSWGASPYYNPMYGYSTSTTSTTTTEKPRKGNNKRKTNKPRVTCRACCQDAEYVDECGSCNCSKYEDDAD